MVLMLPWVEKYVWIHGLSSLVCLVRYKFLHSELCWPSPSFFVRVHIWCAVTCGLAHAWYKHASVPKHFAWEVECPKYDCYLFSKSVCGETHARRCLEAFSKAIVKYSSNFMENVLWKNTSRLPPSSRSTCTRAESPIIMASTQRWHRRNVRIKYFLKHICIMNSLKHFQNR